MNCIQLALSSTQWRDTLITDFQQYMFGIHNFAKINRSFFFQSNHNSPLPLETADDLFDDVSFFCHEYWIFSLQDYSYCCVLCSINLSTSLYLFSVEWRSESNTVLESFGNRKWFDFVLAFCRKLSRSSGLNKSSLFVSLSRN